MKRLNLPPFVYRTIEKEAKTHIFDPLRKKYVCLTPEEWVRQHVTNYLIFHRGYPPALIGIEKQIVESSNKKMRADIFVYDKTCAPVMVIECKAPYKKLSENTLQQMIQYNRRRIPFLVFTNGLQHFCFSMNFPQKHYVLLKEMPSFAEVQRHRNYVLPV